MPWFKVDDALHSHPKARRAGLAAMGLWALAGSHCMDYLTDGVVEHWFVESIPDGKKLAARLVEARLWHEHAEGWVFHDWAEFQPTRESVLAERGAAAERMRRVRANKQRTNGDGSASPVPVPSPDLTKTSASQSSSERARVSTDAVEPSAMTTRLAAQQGVTSLGAVVDAVRQHVHREVTPDAAFQISLHLLDKAKSPRAPQRYVTGSIARSPFEVQKFIDDNALAVTA